MEYNRAKFEKLWQEYEDEFWKETNKNLNNFLNYITNVKKDKNCNLNNNAPKSIKGEYDLSIHGNKIVLVDNADGTTVEAKCHPDDDFDIGAGIKEAFKKLNEKREEIRKQKEEEEKKIKVGDWVEVVEDDSYDVYLSWAYENLNFVHVKEFAYEEVPSIGTKARVIKVAPHSDFSSILLYAIETKNNKVYIVEEGWIKKVKNPYV